MHGLHPRNPKVVKLVHGLQQENPMVVELEDGLHYGCLSDDHRSRRVVKLVMGLHHGSPKVVKLGVGFHQGCFIREHEVSLATAILQANNLTSKTKPSEVEAMYKLLEEGLGQCFSYGQDPLPCKIPAHRIHFAPNSLKYRVYVEKRKDQVQLEAEALGTIRRKPELYCISLKRAPIKGGGPNQEGQELILKFMPPKDMEWAIDGVGMPWYQTDVHWYIIGGQHTYQACISIAAKEVPGSARHKFYTEFDVIPVYSRDPDMLIKVSNALNIQIKDKMVTENFRSQLRNARAKWIEKGRLRLKKGGTKHDLAFKVTFLKHITPPFQNFENQCHCILYRWTADIH